MSLFNWLRKPTATADTTPAAAPASAGATPNAGQSRTNVNSASVSPAERSAALKAQGNAHFAEGQLDKAAECFEAAIASDPRHAAAHFNLGLVRREQAQLPRAIQCFEAAVMLTPDMADAAQLLGQLRGHVGDLTGAVAAFQQALKQDPGLPGIQADLGMALFQQGALVQALPLLEQASALDPTSFDLHFTLGLVLGQLERHEAALAACDKALALRPDNAALHLNRGFALATLRRWREALGAYDAALALAPGVADIHNRRGLMYNALGQLKPALACFDQALVCDRRFADALSNRAMVLSRLRERQAAIHACEALVQVAPDMDYALGGLLEAKIHACDWTGLDALVNRTGQAIARGARAITPFAWLAVSDDPALQRLCSQTCQQDKFPAAPTPLWQGERYQHQRIRVAYLSADFHDHATAYLMAELFELHDSTRFETIALSYGSVTSGSMRTRLEKSFARFIDVHQRSDREIATLMRELEVDIAVDLKGYTADARFGILAHRAAPVQVSYIGYPGTTGASYIDYVIADHQLVEASDFAHYSEKVVRLPDSYQVNDRARRIAEQTPTRASQQLPEQGFVFCCFNNNYKITPAVFGVWMRLLRQVPGSVLWLLADHELAVSHLRREATQRGIDPKRLVFAERAPLPEHLARQRLADLFLDTLPYNAHTTASDALWAGLPVLTCRGASFQARVAASLLHAAQLPELVTTTLADYERMALALAGDATRLAKMRQHLTQHRLNVPLFDTARFCRHLEAAYVTMWERQQSGQAAAAFDVASQD